MLQLHSDTLTRYAVVCFQAVLALVLVLVTEYLFTAVLLLVRAVGSCVSRRGEPVCLGAGSQPVGGGGTTGDGVSALQQVETSRSNRVLQFDLRLKTLTFCPVCVPAVWRRRPASCELCAPSSETEPLPAP